jgi:hypothetical protein
VVTAGAHRTPGWLASTRTLGALAFPLLVSISLVGAGAVGEWLVAGWTLRAWCAGLAAALIARAAWAFRAARKEEALAAAALAALLLQLTAWSALRFEGVIAVGEGEEGGTWERSDRGWAQRPPKVEVVELARTADAAARLRLDGRELGVVRGASARSGGWWVELDTVDAAPGFELRRAPRQVVGSMLVKLEPGRENEFRFERLPHRYFARYDRKDRDPGATPGSLELRVLRGKYTVLRRELAAGEEVELEGLRLRYGEGARWCRLHLRAAVPRWPALVGAALAMGSVLLRLQRLRALRRSSGPDET